MKFRNCQGQQGYLLWKRFYTNSDNKGEA